MTTSSPGNLQFKCGRCDTRLTVKSMFAGKKINCPKCHKKIVVPRQSEGVAEVPDDLSPSLNKPEDKSAASSGNPSDELGRALKRISELEQKVLQVQTESEGMRSRLAAARAR